ncbi:MAG: class I SAM-dependent rRNA methyltransferase [Bdellovibrionia bacterium]
MNPLEQAWQLREQQGLFRSTQALRVFHGPAEGYAHLKNLAIDRFGDHYWVTQWEKTSASNSKPLDAWTLAENEIISFLQSKEAQCIVASLRPTHGGPKEPQLWSGTPPQNRFLVQEGTLKFWIQFQNSRHPGLFLDHAPLRQWLLHSCAGLRVLNTFSYTASLSVAAAAGKASQVTSLDLSQPSLDWGMENFQANQIPLTPHSFLAGDVFEWFPRFKKQGRTFDCIILDPPSFSHGKKKTFSTAKDLEVLHGLAMEVLAPQGLLITSINSANIAVKKFEADILAAARKARRTFNVLRELDLPESFPTPFGQVSDRYLKGWILRSL